MRRVEVSAFDLAQRFIGLSEARGPSSNPLVLGMLRLDSSWPQDDDVPWCSAFCNFVAWLLRLPRSKSLRARSWLAVGEPVSLAAAEPGFDVVILKRGGAAQPGPEVLTAPGHVGFFAGREEDAVGRMGEETQHVLILGGNQGDKVSIARFPASQVLGLRRLA